jgi:hypothetical protein
MQVSDVEITKQYSTEMRGLAEYEVIEELAYPA